LRIFGINVPLDYDTSNFKLVKIIFNISSVLVGLMSFAIWISFQISTQIKSHSSRK
jgi:hypothetical protein